MLHDSIIEIIHRSGLKGGMGMISRPGYWLGVQADARCYLTGRNLFRLWQEVYLLESCGDLPSGSADNLESIIKDIPLLRPANFFEALHLWAAQSYVKLPIAILRGLSPTGTGEQILLGMLSDRGDFGQEKHETHSARNTFGILKRQAMGEKISDLEWARARFNDF